MDNNKNSGDHNSGNHNSGYRNSGNHNSGYRNSGNHNSGYRNSGDHNSGDHNSGNHNSGNHNSGNHNSGYRNSGNYNSGDHNSGNHNSGNHNSGYFNTNEPSIRIFNKETSIKREDIVFPDFFYFDLTQWVSYDTATDEEKVKYKSEIETCGGFLKTIEYKEAWKRAWVNATDEDRKKVFDLPNFDAEIFEEITGIDVNKENKSTLEISVKLNGKEVPFSSLSKETIEKLMENS